MNTKVADQAWISLALLQRENPERADFQTDEVLKRAKREFGALAPGVRQHLGSHAVASTPPSPGKYRMFTRTAHGRLRLYENGDPTHPERTGKMVPNAEDIPEKYRELLKWHSGSQKRGASNPGGSTPAAFLAFVGLIPAYDLRQMEELIERDCERIESQGGEGKDAA